MLTNECAKLGNSINNNTISFEINNVQFSD